MNQKIMEQFRYTKAGCPPEITGWFCIEENGITYEGRTDGSIILLQRVGKSPKPKYVSKAISRMFSEKDIFSGIELNTERLLNIVSRFKALHNTKCQSVKESYPYSVGKSLDSHSWEKAVVTVSLCPGRAYFHHENVEVGEGMIWMDVDSDVVYDPEEYRKKILGFYLESVCQAFESETVQFSLSNYTWKFENEEGIIFVLPVSVEEKVVEAPKEKLCASSSGIREETDEEVEARMNGNKNE